MRRTGRLGSAFGALLLVGAVLSPAACARGDKQEVVHVLGTWETAEQRVFEDVVAPFERKTGIDVQFEGTRDVSAVLAARVEDGDPPELAIVSSPGDLLHYAKTNRLTPLDVTNQPAYAPEWLTPGQVYGKQLAVVLKAALKSTIWYNKAKLSEVGRPLPTTWPQLLEVTAALRASGVTPWCIGLASSTTSGWAGTDWIEDLVLARSGPDVYDAWSSGNLSWRAPQIRAAWQSWGEVVNTPDTVAGGTMTALSTNHVKADQVLDTRAGCAFDHQASFMAGTYAARSPAGASGAESAYDAMAFPGFGTPTPREVAGDLAAIFHPTSAAQELLRYLTSTQAQEIWVRSGTSLSPDRKVSPSAYKDKVSERLGTDLATATSVRFDASDLMPPTMRDAFQRAVLAFVSAPGDLDRILEDLDQVRVTAY
jgi:alpha-glucoside transport system substrate-binding protein